MRKISVYVVVAMVSAAVVAPSGVAEAYTRSECVSAGVAEGIVEAIAVEQCEAHENVPEHLYLERGVKAAVSSVEKNLGSALVKILVIVGMIAAATLLIGFMSYHAGRMRNE